MHERIVLPVRFSNLAVYENRTIRQWSQHDLAERIRGRGLLCSKSAIGAWERDVTPNANHFLAMSEVFGNWRQLVLWSELSVCIAYYRDCAVLTHGDSYFVVGPWLTMPELINPDIARLFAQEPYQLDSYCSQLSSWVRDNTRRT